MHHFTELLDPKDGLVSEKNNREGRTWGKIASEQAPKGVMGRREK